MGSNTQCWETVLAGNVEPQALAAALVTLTEARLPPEAFTPTRVEALCGVAEVGADQATCTAQQPHAPGGGAPAAALRLLTHWALDLGGRDLPAGTAELARRAADAALAQLRAAHDGPAAGAALHCTGALVHVLEATAAEAVLHAALAAWRARPLAGAMATEAPDGSQPSEAALGLAHCVAASARHPPTLAAAATAALLSLPAAPLLPLHRLLVRAAEALVMGLRRGAARYVEPLRGGPPATAARPQAPLPSPPPVAFTAAAREVGAALEASASPGDAAGAALAALAGGALLHAAHSQRAALPPAGAQALAELEAGLSRFTTAAAAAAPRDYAPALAAATALAPLWQLGRRPAAGPPLLTCLLAALLRGCLDLPAFFGAAAAGEFRQRGEAPALAFLAQQAAGAPDAALLTSVAAAQLEQLAEASTADAGDALLPALQPWAAELHAGYRDYVAAAPPGWLEPGSRLAAALEARLSQASGAAVALLLAAFGAAEQPMGFAAQVLDVLAYLEFARSASPQHSALLSAAFAATAASSSVAAGVLELLAPPVAAALADGADLVSASRALLLMRAASVALPGAPCWSLRRRADATMPLVAAGVTHPAAPLRAVAHQLATRLLGCAGSDGAVVEAMAGAYLRACLAAFPALTSMAQLAAGVAAALAVLPPDSLLPVWLVDEAAGVAADMLVRPGAGGAAAKAAEQMAQLAVEVLLQVGVQAQPAAMRVMEERLRGAAGGARAKLLAALYAGVSASDNRVMKVPWVRWYQALAAAEGDIAAAMSPQ